MRKIKNQETRAKKSRLGDYQGECSQWILSFQSNMSELGGNYLCLRKVISPIQSLPHGHSCHHQEECCLVLYHSELLLCDSDDEGNPMQMPHQWLYLFSGEGSRSSIHSCHHPHLGVATSLDSHWACTHKLKP